MASFEGKRILRLSSRRQRMGDTASASGERDGPTASAGSIRQDHRAVHDDRTRPSQQADTLTMAAIEGGVPELLEARGLLDRFHAMVRRKSPDLDGWIADAANSLMASFAAGIRKDRCAVMSAIASPWSNGQTEGQITKLKLVKRQIYGRAKIDLLEARPLSTA